VHYSVIVPTLNEVENIDVLITRLLALPGLAQQAEIIFVEDGSTDGTIEKLEAWQARAPVRLLRRAGPPDLTQAIRDGVAAARHDAVVVMDADLSHAPEAVPELLAPLLAGTHDLVVGSRRIAGGGCPGWPLRRRMLSRLGGLLAWPISDLSDPTSGYFAARRALFDRLSPRAAGYKILLELAVAAGPEARIAEVPIIFHDRAAGRSKLSLRTNLLFLARLAALAGTSLSARGLARSAVTAAEAAALDAVVVGIAWALGVRLPVAALAGFAVGLIASIVLDRSRSAELARSWTTRLPLAAFVALLALAMRCTVLAWAGRGAFPALLVVLVAVAASGLVNWLGTIFLVLARPAAVGGAEARWRTVALALIAYLFVLRLFYFGLPMLTGNEAYYWAYAVHPSLSYLDHPPMVAWLIQLGTGIAGHSEFGVRLTAPACWLIAALFIYGLTRDLLGKATGIRALLLMMIMPYFYEAGYHMTPDAPLIASWAAALYFLARLLVVGDRRAWLGLGLAFGLGALSKYTIVLLALGALGFVLSDAAARRWLRRPQSYMAVALATLLFTPVLVWNAEHEWASFLFQSARRLEHPTGSSGTLIAWGMLVLHATPTVVAAIALSFFRRSSMKEPDAAERGRRLLRFALLVPLAVFLVVGLRTPLKGYWMAPPLLAAVPLVAELMGVPSLRSWPAARLLDRVWVPTAAIATLFFGFVLLYASVGLPPLLARAKGTDWRAVAAAVEAVERRATGTSDEGSLTVVMDSHEVASEIAFYDPDGKFNDITNQQIFGRKGLMYAYWMNGEEAAARHPIILVGAQPSDMGGTEVEPYLDGATAIQEVPGGRLAPNRPLYYRTAYGLRTTIAMLPSGD
jgi:dolichol-phosphate mannosyltransferase